MKEENIDHLIKELYREDSSPIEVPHGLGKRLELFIDELETKEKTNRIKQLRIFIGSVAASVAIILAGLNFYHSHSSSEDILSLRPTVEDPYQAYIETQKALSLLSINFNKGLEGWNKVEEEVERTNKIVTKIIKTTKQ